MSKPYNLLSVLLAAAGAAAATLLVTYYADYLKSVRVNVDVLRVWAACDRLTTEFKPGGAWTKELAYVPPTKSPVRTKTLGDFSISVPSPGDQVGAIEEMDAACGTDFIRAVGPKPK